MNLSLENRENKEEYKEINLPKVDQIDQPEDEIFLPEIPGEKLSLDNIYDTWIKQLNVISEDFNLAPSKKINKKKSKNF